MAYKFQREWQQIAKNKDEEQQKTIEELLSEGQKKRVEFLAQAITELSIYEQRYLIFATQQKILKTTNIDLMKLNIDWPSLKQLENGSWPPNNPNWFLQQEAIAKLWPAGQEGMSFIFNSLGMGGGGAGAPAGSGQSVPGKQSGSAASEAKVEAPKEEKVEPKVEEKQNFDIELAGVDAAQKIKIIKEVRGIMNLGLKEAKDLVEKTPQIIKKGLKKSEAEELKEKLTAIGCQINLL